MKHKQNTTTHLITDRDQQRIRALATQWMELAIQPVMAERKPLWRAVHDLKMVRPMILVETSSVEGFVTSDDLVCQDPFLRAVERNLLETVRHAEEVGDDVVVEPYYRLGWQMSLSDFGVAVETKPATTSTGETSLGYSFNFPIKTQEEIVKLKRRSLGVDREKTLQMKRVLEDVMGDILPVRVGNYDPFNVDPGDDGWTGMFFFGLTWQPLFSRPPVRPPAFPSTLTSKANS